MMGIDLKFLGPTFERVAKALERMADAQEEMARTARIQAEILAGHSPTPLHAPAPGHVSSLVEARQRRDRDYG